jgi:TRAP-type C4-dicarboxylate transport system permease small subunit
VSEASEREVAFDAAGGRFTRGLAYLLSAVGTIWIALMMLVIVADVLGRNFFNSPITGVAEVAARSVVAIAFLQVAAAVLNGRMTRADFLIRYLRHGTPKLARLVEFTFAMVGAIVFAAIIHAVWPDTLRAWQTNEYFGVRGVFTIPTLPFRAIIIVGSGVTVMAYLAVAWRQLIAIWNKTP